MRRCTESFYLHPTKDTLYYGCLKFFLLFFNIDNDVAVVVTVADFIVDAYALFVALELASL